MLLGTAYIAGLSMLFIGGAGILAAYLAMPGWLLVGALIFRAPESVFSAFSSWGGNLILLVVSAALNIAAVYVVLRRFSKA